jgi:hypothetical protein
MFVDEKKYRCVMEGWAEWSCSDIAGARGYPKCAAFVNDKIDSTFGPIVPIDSCEIYEQVEIYVVSLRVVDMRLVNVLRAHFEAQHEWFCLEQEKKAAKLGMSHGTFRNLLGKANVGVQAYMGRDNFTAVIGSADTVAAHG